MKTQLIIKKKKRMTESRSVMLTLWRHNERVQPEGRRRDDTARREN